MTIQTDTFCSARREEPAFRSSRLMTFIMGLEHEIQMRRALRDLAALDDTALYDIGVSRGGIEDAVRHGRR